MRKFLFIILLLIAHRLQAEEQLTFDEALRLALSQNSAILAATHAQTAAEKERKAAIGLRMPRIGITGGYAHLGSNIGYDFNPLKKQFTQLLGQVEGALPGSMQSWIGELTRPLLGDDWQFTIQEKELGFIEGEITFPIWMGGKINAANRIAAIGVEEADLKMKTLKDQLTSEVVTRYFGVKLAQNMVELAELAVITVEAHLHEAQLLKESGLLAETDLLYVKYRLSEAQRDLTKARLELETIRSALGKSLGEELPTNPITELFILHELDPMVNFQTKAEIRNPQLQEVALKRKAAHEGVRVLRSEFFPEVFAIGGGNLYTYQVSQILPRWAVGIGLRWRLFNGLNREYRYAAAQATEKRVEALEIEAHSQVALLVENLYRQLIYESDRFHTTTTSLKYAEAYLHNQRIAFREGMSNSTEVLDAELELRKIRTERLKCAYQFDVALARLLEAIGESERFSEYIRQGERVVLDQTINKE